MTGTPSLHVPKRLPHSASAAEDITFFMMVDVRRRAPLLLSLNVLTLMSPGGRKIWHVNFGLQLSWRGMMSRCIVLRIMSLPPL